MFASDRRADAFAGGADHDDMTNFVSSRKCVRASRTALNPG